MNPFRSSIRSRLSTATAAAAVESRPPGWPDSLYTRVVLVSNPKVSVVPVLEKWINEGKQVSKADLQWMVKQMRNFRRYAHALQISMWMSDRRYFPLTPGDYADRLYLISKLQGLEHAENYFNNISVQMKAYQTYGTLLNCYAEEKNVEKAEAIFQKMKELKILTSFSFNAMMKLYSNTSRLEKVKSIFREMQKKGIPADCFTNSILMEAYVAASDTDGIDKLLQKLKHPNAAKSWHVYAVAAKGYAKAMLVDEALKALKKSEELVPQKKGRVAYGFLLTVCAEMGSKDDLYKVWHKYKSSEKQCNSMFMCMISALLKLDDIEGAETILKEWESQTSFYDFRVPNLLIAAYCKNGLLGKAESLLNESLKTGRTPFANSWERLANGCFEDDQTSKAVEFMKKALVAGQQHEWKPSPVNITSSLEYFKDQKNVEGAEEFVKLVRFLAPLTREIYNCLLEVYLAAGKPVLDVLKRMEDDGFNADKETHGVRRNENLQKL
ncbi:pentatricopeptide repeat-containing protein At2g20710, mitochondrial [Dioscorea cayenensis subsp. rotundata]|uniref:Pentatricopeptide repeat-containing protein At2g20710, mitochondrial n=1 Tax=Dioscorea cayennensis subsp. rotundata TaxID=55577 RepID=A0AB40AKV7_DIOCR|nr:pentatricopeptide repeat-containing protein At2g20710, mitochondrial [Dioscorea cayenensis subsp. rotundata]